MKLRCPHCGNVGSFDIPGIPVIDIRKLGGRFLRSTPPKPSRKAVSTHDETFYKELSHFWRTYRLSFAPEKAS